MRNGAVMGSLFMSLVTKQNKQIEKHEKEIEKKQKELERLSKMLNKK